MRLQPTRDLETVVLDEGVRERIATDLGAFRRARDRYRELGVPWRRGYLFHGPPGCGKTSFARALAGHFDMPIYLVSLTGQGISDQRLIEALNDARPESILLIEDVDAAFDARARRRPGSDGLTFSGLLNAVDGIAAQEGRVIIMTTNHRDRLEPALIRPGRVDVEQYFGLATPDQVRELFLRFFPGQDRLAEWVAGAIPPQTASPAQLQGMFLEARDEPMAAVREVVGRWGVRNLRALPAPGRVG